VVGELFSALQTPGTLESGHIRSPMVPEEPRVEVLGACQHGCQVVDEVGGA